MFSTFDRGLTREQWRRFKKATNCHYICFKGFKLSNPKVTDHCHYTGKYRGLAHSIYNVKYKVPHYIPIVFHNLSRYDAHLFIRKLGKKFDTGKIGVIARNKEKYISCNVDVIVDSYTDNSSDVEEKEIQLRSIQRRDSWQVA